MSITPPAPIPGQYGFNGSAPFVNQQNFGQLTGECNAWNLGMGAPLVQNAINNALRQYLDRRLWYGCLVRGQIATTGYYSTGTVAFTLGSNIVQGINTGWTQNINGYPITQQAIRAGYISPVMQITSLNQAAQQLTIDLPWALPSTSSTGYYLCGYYYPIVGCKFVYSMKNMQLMYRMNTNVPQSLIENLDPTRMTMMYPRAAVTMPPDPNGNYQVEIWPVASTPQPLPYLAYCQPSNLVNDADNLPPYVRADIIKNMAIAEILLYKSKTNPSHSESMCLAISQEKRKIAEGELFQAAQMDENLWRQDVTTQWESLPLIDLQTGYIGGAMVAAMSPQMAGGWDDY
jgi:hypothetical protein